MAEITNSKKQTLVPDTSSQLVRARWLELLDLSYATRCVTQQEIEPGVHAVVVPAACRKETSEDLLELEIRAAMNQVPAMAMGVRFTLERLGELASTLPADYHGWMGAWGKDISAGETRVTAFIDLAYLESALLSHLWDHNVLVEFGSPLAFFRRGALTDYANIHEAVVAMLATGDSLAEAADNLATAVRGHLQIYANAYHQLSSIYSQAEWRIDRDNFVIEVSGSGLSLALQYWELRVDWGSLPKILNAWGSRIENLLLQAVSSPNSEFPKSYAV